MHAARNAETCARNAVILSKNSLPVPERAASAMIRRRTSTCSGEQIKCKDAHAKVAQRDLRIGVELRPDASACPTYSSPAAAIMHSTNSSSLEGKWL